MTFISPETHMRIENEWLEMRRGTQILPRTALKSFSHSGEHRSAPDVGGKTVSEMLGDLPRDRDTPGKSKA